MVLGFQYVVACCNWCFFGKRQEILCVSDIVLAKRQVMVVSPGASSVCQ